MTREDEYGTAGERLAQRPLKMERRAGIPHYKTGQVYARRAADVETEEGVRVYFLSYVSALGHLQLIPVAHAEDDFYPLGSSMEATVHRVWPLRPLPENFSLSEGMLYALREAVERE